MRAYTLWMIGAFASLFAACDEQEIEVFGGINRIYFEKFYRDALYPGTEEADSTTTSFFLYPEGTKVITAKLIVLLSGKKLDGNLTFGLKVMPEGTTATPEEYDLEETYTFHANTKEKDTDIRDTIEIRINNSDRLEGLGAEGVKLMVELVPGEGMELGQYERRRAKVTWSYVEAQPEWWDAEVAFELLGEYSPEKYKLFLQHADTGGQMEELIKHSPDKAIAMVMKFKEWLVDHVNDPGHGAEYQEMLDSLKV